MSRTIGWIILILLFILAIYSVSIFISKLRIEKEKPKSVEEIFSGFIGNEGVVQHLITLVKYTKTRYPFQIPNMALFGPSSSGKTDLSKRVAKALDLKFTVISQSRLSSESAFIDLLLDISFGSGLVRKLLPQVIFIDEVHTLSRKLQDYLLTGLESDDRIIRAKLFTFDCKDVSFIVATTDPGKLAPAFRNRFTALHLKSLGENDLVSILKSRMKDKDIESKVNLLNDDCLKLIARVAKFTPREAISLLKQIGISMAVGETYPNLKSVYEKLNQITGSDFFGLRETDWKYLNAIQDNILGLNSLSSILALDKDTITNVIEPFLLQLNLIEFSPRGRKITSLGKEFIDFNRRDNNGIWI